MRTMQRGHRFAWLPAMLNDVLAKRSVSGIQVECGEIQRAGYSGRHIGILEQ